MKQHDGLGEFYCPELSNTVVSVRSNHGPKLSERRPEIYSASWFGTQPSGSGCFLPAACRWWVPSHRWEGTGDCLPEADKVTTDSGDFCSLKLD